MPRDLRTSVEQLGQHPAQDAVRDAPAVAAVASRARDAADCALLLDALGLSDSTQTTRALLGLGRLKTAR